MILDNWQRVLADLGVVGPDQGRGGKYLIMPPGYGPVEAPGYFVVQSTSRVLAGFRLLGGNAEAAIAELVPQIRTYCWTVEGTGEPMTARAAGDLEWSQMPPRGMAYWESLNETIQRNPIEERDRFFLAQLRFLGIERGQPFEPDERQTRLLEEGGPSRRGDGQGQHHGQAGGAAVLGRHQEEARAGRVRRPEGPDLRPARSAPPGSTRPW
jgi:hypothetical protein